MTDGLCEDIAEAQKGTVLLGILPMFLRKELVQDRKFRQSVGFGAEEFITYGCQIAFPRSDFFASVRAVFSEPSSHAEVFDKENRPWTFSCGEISDGRIALKISSAEESFCAVEFFPFSPNSEQRLSEFSKVLREHGFPPDGLASWRKILRDRSFTDDELEKFSQDIVKTPQAFLKGFRKKASKEDVDATDMVPSDIEYYESLCGRGCSSTLSDLSSEVVAQVLSDYLKWDTVEGARMALLLSSHPLFSEQLGALGLSEQQLIVLAEWCRDHGDVFAKVGVVEAALPTVAGSRGLGEVLDEIVKQIIALDPEDKSGPLQMMMGAVAIVESEISRTRTLRDWSPFKRRLATFAHAALLAREAAGGADVKSLSAWIMQHHGMRFYLQSLLDLQAEPRWFPEQIHPDLLKQELLGRLSNAVGKLKGGLGEGPLRDTLDLQSVEAPFNTLRRLESHCPGPLEGSEASPRNPIPSEIEEILDHNLSEEKLTVKSVLALINSSGLFLVQDEKAERAVKIIRASNFRFADQLSSGDRINLLNGLAGAASRLRSESLARSVRAVSRTYRDDSEAERSYSEEVIICLRSAGAFREFQAWKDFVGEWINELCFSVSAEVSGELRTSVEMICSIEPRLRTELGKGLAALASIR